MTTTRIETIPTAWDEERDVAFFHIVQSLFTPEFCYGASVLLASYDAEPATAGGRVPADAVAADTALGQLARQP